MYVLYDSVHVTDDLVCCADGDPVVNLVSYSFGSVGGQSLEVSQETQIATVEDYTGIEEDPSITIDDVDDGGASVVDPSGTADDASAGAEVEELPEQSSDSTSDTEDDSSSDTDDTESVTIADIYDVTVTQSYLLVVIAFGVFLTCGILLGKAFWDRLKR